MPYDIYGNFTRVHNWETDKNTGIKILASRMDAEFNGIGTALNQVVLRNGVAGMTGNLNLGNNSVTSLADGTAGSPAVRFFNSASTGIFSPTANTLALSANATKVVDISSTDVAVTGNLSASGNTAVTGNVDINGSIDVAGAAIFSGIATFGGKVTTPASAVGGAGLVVSQGVAPTSPVNGEVWITTSGLYARVNGVTQGPYIYGSIPGGTLSSGLVLAANSATVTPLTFQSGTLNTTPVAGGCEFDGRLFYQAFSATDRMLVPSREMILQGEGVPLTGLTYSSGGRVFRGTTNGALTVPVGIYKLEILLCVQGAVPDDYTVTFGGTIGNNGIISGSSLWAVDAVMGSKGFGGGGLLSYSHTSPTGSYSYYSFSFNAILIVTVAGTIIPIITNSSGGNVTPYSGNYMEVTPLAITTNTTKSVGNWS